MEVEKMKFGKNSFTPDFRNLADMGGVLYDTKWAKKAGNPVLYWFYRGVYHSPADKKVMEANDLRYDVTIIPPGRLGTEFVKTKGHYHPKKPHTSVAYPEIYEVISGEAHYLLQKEENGHVVDVVMVKAVAGDKVVIPPGYGHITINASSALLKMCNWVCADFSSEYGSIEKLRGGAYFMLADGKIIKNKNYGKLPKLRFINAKDLGSHGIKKGSEMYELVNNIKLLRFLTHPEEGSKLFVI